MLPDGCLWLFVDQQQLIGVREDLRWTEDEFTAVLTAPQALPEFDHIVFDTAPTGHTLRLLTLPSALSARWPSTRQGPAAWAPLAALDQQREQCATAVTTLADPARTTLILVSRGKATKLRSTGAAPNHTTGRLPANVSLKARRAERPLADVRGHGLR